MASSEVTERLGPAMNDEVSREREWEEACRREDVIRALLSQRTSALSAKEVEGAADDSGLAGLLCTAWSGFIALGELFRRFSRDQLAGRRNQDRSRQNAKRYRSRRSVDSTSSGRSRSSASWCKRSGSAALKLAIAPANWRTIKSRVEDLDARSVALRRGDKATIKATKATPGHYVAARPLAVVQIDHTRVDVVVVDEETRSRSDRPWLTLAMDVFSRMVTGFM